MDGMLVLRIAALAPMIGGSIYKEPETALQIEPVMTGDTD